MLHSTSYSSQLNYNLSKTLYKLDKSASFKTVPSEAKSPGDTSK